MIYGLKVMDTEQVGQQFEFDIMDDKVFISPVDLADDSSWGFSGFVDKGEFMQMLNSIKFNESGHKATGDISELADTIKNMLSEFGFTTPLLDGNDNVAYDAFTMRMIGLLEAVKNGTFKLDFQPILCDKELTDEMNKDGE